MSHNHSPMTDERKETFLRVLSETGSFTAAARAATPWGTGKLPGYRTWYDLCKRDPEFAEAVAEARVAALGRIEEEIVRRAFKPDERPILDRTGKVVAVATDHRNANLMLLRAAEKLSPGDWAPKKNISGVIQHDHQHEHEFRFVIEPAHVMLLPEAERAEFIRMLESIQTRMNPEKTNEQSIDARPLLPAPRVDPGSEGAGGPVD